MAKYSREEYKNLTKRYKKIKVEDPDCDGCVFASISDACSLGGNANTYQLIGCTIEDIFYIFKKKPIVDILKTL